MLSLTPALLSGLAGAVALNVAHETLRHLVPRAPRIDRLGERALQQALAAAGAAPPSEGTLYGPALVGDLASNAAYYSAVGLGGPEGAWTRGALLGIAAGVGAVLLPPALGLSRRPAARTPTTAALTVGLYTLGGLAAAAVYRWRSAAEKSSA